MKNQTCIVADYTFPAAVMIPHCRCDLIELLENIAKAVSFHCGVILLSEDAGYTKKFIETTDHPDHFSIVTAPYDTPWIRDRSPVAVKCGNNIRWLNPIVEKMGRPNDDVLFKLISASNNDCVPLGVLPQGNMVAGQGGLMLVTLDILKANHLTYKNLKQYNQNLGVSNWLVFTGFAKETTGHADVHVRVLAKHLYAVAWNQSVKQDRQRMQRLIEMLLRHDEKAEIIKIPIRSRGHKYASLVNWIQLGKNIIVPQFDETPRSDREQTKKLLNEHGFEVEFIYSPTSHLGGSLHCLTASIFV